MNIVLLRTFLEVSRLRHFGHAAEGLHVTQAAVSARIQQLESTLGTPLFDRSTRDLKLTPAGHRLLRHADSLVAGWRKAQQDVALGEGATQVSIGGSLRLWDVLLRDWLQQLRRREPHWAIIAESFSTELLTRRLLDGLLDVAIMLEPAQVEFLQITAVNELELVMTTRRAGACSEEVVGDSYVHVDWGAALAMEHARSFPDAPPPLTRVTHARMALDYIVAMGGAAYLPRRMIEEQLAAGLLHVVADAPVYAPKVYAVFPLRSAQTEQLEQCIDLLRPHGRGK
jgi:DNA-binding transcriptional LysR family regulator